MKKTGILTFHRVASYGALLQTYALKKALTSLGAESHIINYEAGFMKKNPVKRFMLTLARKLLSMPVPADKILPFSRKHITGANAKTLKRKDLPALNCEYDIFVCGSDQVWNGDITWHDTSYMFDFVTDDSKKFSYAASFGISELTRAEKGLYAPLLKKFNRITVREQQGAAIVEELTSKRPVVVLDPTMLLAKEEWGALAVTPEKKGYILAYLLNADDKAVAFVDALAERTGCRVIYLALSLRFKLKRKIDAEFIGCSVEEFLGYYMNAEYVVSNSFHGIVFSIIFNKNFYAALVPPPSKRNSRIENIMETFGLSHRFIDKFDKYDKDADLTINYGPVNEILNKKKEESAGYLREILK